VAGGRGGVLHRADPGQPSPLRSAAGVLGRAARPMPKPPPSSDRPGGRWSTANSATNTPETLPPTPCAEVRARAAEPRGGPAESACSGRSDRSLYAVRLDVAGLARMEVRRRRTAHCLREVIAAIPDGRACVDRGAADDAARGTERRRQAYLSPRNWLPAEHDRVTRSFAGSCSRERIANSLSSRRRSLVSTVRMRGR